MAQKRNRRRERVRRGIGRQKRRSRGGGQLCSWCGKRPGTIELGFGVIGEPGESVGHYCKSCRDAFMRSILGK